MNRLSMLCWTAPVLLLPVFAQAYELTMQDRYDASCPPGVPVPVMSMGTTQIFHARTGHFTAPQTATIMAAMDAWSGSNPRNIGWNLDLDLGPNNPTATFGDGQNSIFKADVNTAAALAALGFGPTAEPEALGFQIYDRSGCPGFALLESDIVITDTLESGAPAGWQDLATYDIPGAFSSGNTQHDLGSTLVHEFGHHLGFAHHTDHPNVMWPSAPGLGRAMNILTIDADHAEGMRWHASTGADGDNVGLTRVFRYEGRPSPGNPTGESAFAWFHDDSVWEIGASGYNPTTGTSVVRRYATFRPRRQPYTGRYTDVHSPVRGGPVHLHNWGTSGRLVALEFYLVADTLLSPTSPIQACDIFPQGDQWLVYREVLWLPRAAVVRRNPVIEAPWRPAPGTMWAGPGGIPVPAQDPTGPTGAGRDYRLCAMIDADQALSETSELDNVAISNTIVRVIP